MTEAVRPQELSGELLVRRIINREIFARARFNPQEPQATSIYGLFEELKQLEGGEVRRFSACSDGASRRPPIVDTFKEMKVMEAKYSSRRGFLEKESDYSLSHLGKSGLTLEITIPDVLANTEEKGVKTGDTIWERLRKSRANGSEKQSEMRLIPGESYSMVMAKSSGDGNTEILLIFNNREKVVITRSSKVEAQPEGREYVAFEYRASLAQDFSKESVILLTEVTG